VKRRRATAQKIGRPLDGDLPVLVSVAVLGGFGLADA
jgi:hypothetical protein